MTKYYGIPDGEVGSINNLSVRVVTSDSEELSNLAMELFDQPQVCLNVIHNLKNYNHSDIALSFTESIIKYKLK